MRESLSYKNNHWAFPANHLKNALAHFQGRHGSIILTTMVSLLFISCKPQTKPSATPNKQIQEELFTDHTVASGINFTHQAGDPTDYFMPRSLGSGVALLDFNLDGFMDIYCLQNAGPGSEVVHQLFKQTPNGTFEDVTSSSGLGVDGHGMGVTAGDLTNDGYPDLLVTGYLHSRLFVNIQGTHFKEVSTQSKIDNPAWGMSASFLDYDRDGWLDIVIANYIEYAPSVQCTNSKGEQEFCGPDGFPSAVPKLYRHTGRLEHGAPVFEDATTASGLAGHPGPGLGVACFDVNGDGWVDIFFADDAKPNRLFINQQNGQFKEEGLKRGIALDAMGQTRANMGVGVGDVDHDGLLDLFVTHLATERHTLWRQGPQGIFSDRTASFGLNDSDWRGTGFGALMADFNNDGLTDIAFVNGDIRAIQSPESNETGASIPFWQKYAQRNQLFLHQGGTTFRDVSNHNPAFCKTSNVGRGLAYGDLNNDGAIDLILSSIDSPLKILMGKPEKIGHWLTIQATLPNAGNREDIGAEITVTSGDHTWRRWLNPAMGYLCSNDPRLHFGLGTNDQTDAIEILWSDGSRESFPGTSANHILTIQKGTGTLMDKE